MNWTAIRKRLQRQSFDLLAQRHGLLIIFVAVVVIFVTLVNFGESLATWSAEKYAAVVNSFSDNVVGQSYRGRLCLPIPIDVVYTWVNGSDPQLLKELHSYKETMLSSMKTVQNTSEISVCKFDNCVFANGIAIEPPVPSEISLKHLGFLYPSFKNAQTMVRSVDPVTGHNVSLVLFGSKETAEASLKQAVVIQQRTAIIRRLFYTTEKALRNTVPASNIAIMIGFPNELDNEQLLAAFPQEHRSGIVKLTLRKDKGIAVLTMSDDAAWNALLSSKNISISGKSPTFREASFVWDLTDYRHNEDISASRFEDNDELRYSLRSVEKHAPWVRHIFIVTNGQIPSWLNLDDERVTVVSHSDIFVNKSHLPTFSSPAIESHLHRIPGLSDWFIYMNDDVLFGRDVWPDDFVTASGAHKVYLTWPVPNCNDGCPASWISDGYCDRACNNSQCEWDGGDCVGSAGRAQYPFYGLSGGGNAAHLARSSDLYCNQGCANNWIADRYCDQSCNVRACGFDAADCGTASFYQLFGIDLYQDKKHYDAKGTDVVYFNLSTLIGGDSGSILSGSFSQDAIVRSASISRKFKVVTVVLYHNETERMLNFSLSVKHAVGRNVTYNFTIIVDTLHENDGTASDAKQPISHPADTTKAPETEPSEMFTFISYASRKSPKPKYSHKPDSNFQQVAVPENITGDDIPVSAKNEYESLLQQFESGDLTQGGFRAMLIELLKEYAQSHSEKASNETKPLISKEQLEASNLAHRNRSVPLTATVHSTTQVLNFRGFRFNKIQVGEHDKFEKQDKLPGRHLNYLHDSEETFRTLSGQKLAADRYAGFLPWEKSSVFSKLNSQEHESKNTYETNSNAGKRRLLDTYADSLRHVSRVYNRAYGYTARRVPGHMPHMINRNIAASMQAKFPKEWDMTSSHRMRHPDDMQFAFSYFYFLMSEPLNASIDDLFAEVDMDKSGVLSDRELRILATRIYDLPIDLQTLEALERTIINCSEENVTLAVSSELQLEVYYDKRMPQVTLEFVKTCPVITDALQKQLKSRTKYSFEVVGEDDIIFKMLNANVSRVVAILDEIRQKPRKFICLNDNVDYEQASAKTVKVVLRDYYESFFPKPSRFELPLEYRNRFLHVEELHAWWHYRTWLRRFTVGCLSVAVLFALVSFYSDRVYYLRRRWSRH